MSYYYSYKYCVIYLSGTGPGEIFEIDNYYIPLLTDILTVMDKYSNDIVTVFKPHIISDMGCFWRLLDKLQFGNWIVAYDHPEIMAVNAQFVMAYTYSVVLFDAYRLGKPIVLYTYYPPDVLEALGGKSEGGECCDYFINRDKKELDKVMGKLILGKEPK